jgi:hypothetical protein
MPNDTEVFAIELLMPGTYKSYPQRMFTKNGCITSLADACSDWSDVDRDKEIMMNKMTENGEDPNRLVVVKLVLVG